MQVPVFLSIDTRVMYPMILRYDDTRNAEDIRKDQGDAAARYAVCVAARSHVLRL